MGQRSEGFRKHITIDGLRKELQKEMRRVMALSGSIGPSTVHTDNLGMLDGLWRGREGCSGPKQKDADLWRKI